MKFFEKPYFQVEFLDKDKLTGAEQIQVYLIGKLFAKEAELATSDAVGNKELMDELGILKDLYFPG